MIDVERIATGLWASLVAVFIGVFLMSLASPASAAIFTKCTPDESAWVFLKDPKLQEEAKHREQIRCDADNAVLDAWAPKIKTLEDVKEKIDAATTAGNWEAFRAALDEAKGPLLELQAQARGQVTGSFSKIPPQWVRSIPHESAIRGTGISWIGRFQRNDTQASQTTYSTMRVRGQPGPISMK